MKTINFCDTSAIIKLYHDEIGSAWMETLFDDAESAMIISELTIVEFYSAILKKVRTGEITNEAKDEAIRNFEKDCRDRYMIPLLDSRIIKNAKNLLNKYGNNFSFRTLDAIQLAACLNEKTNKIRFICADVNLLKIGKLEGLQTINPETV